MAEVEGLFGMVHVLKGAHRGEIGHYDNDGDDDRGRPVAIVGFRDVAADCVYEVNIPHDALEALENTDDVVDAWHHGRPYASLGRDARYRGRTDGDGKPAA